MLKGMSVRNLTAGVCACALLSVSSYAAAPPADVVTVNRIADAAFNHSQVVDIAAYLADQIGGRMTNSPAMRRAERWTQEQFKLELGLSEGPVRTGRASTFWQRIWWIESAHVRMLAPRPLDLHGIPIAWTPATNGALSAAVIVAPMISDKDFADWKGKLSGKIVLVTWPGPPKDDGEAPFQRLNDADIAKLDKYQEPTFDPEARQKRIDRFRFRTKLDAFLAEKKGPLPGFRCRAPRAVPCTERAMAIASARPPNFRAWRSAPRTTGASHGWRNSAR